MAAATAPRQADTSMSTFAFLSLARLSLLLARRLSVVILVFEVAGDGARRAAAGTLTLTDRLQIARLTATILHHKTRVAHSNIRLALCCN